MNTEQEILNIIGRLVKRAKRDRERCRWLIKHLRLQRERNESIGELLYLLGLKNQRITILQNEIRALRQTLGYLTGREER